jgi:hypothetical protein
MMESEDTMDDYPIYYNDLNADAQKKVLEFLSIDTPEDGNLDVMPLAYIPKPENV